MSKNPSVAWLFDVDGVITNPQQKKVTEPQILKEIAKRLELNQPVALVTGRSLDFMKARVINPLAKILKDNKSLQNFLAVGEKGGVWISYDSNSHGSEEIDKSISVPQALQEEVRSLVENKFPETMFFDETKRTMISTEMKDGISLNNYHAQQKDLCAQLEELLEKHNLKDRLEVDPSTIATDIQNKHVGKDFAAKRVISWLKERKVSPKRFITFGDTHSDIKMAEEVHKQGFNVEFVFVREKDKLGENNYPFKVAFTNSQFEKGTLEYLSQSSET